MKKIVINKKDLIFWGDHHEGIHHFAAKARGFNYKDCAIIQCGDMGIGFESEDEENKLFDLAENILKSLNIDLYVLRGNHDNPSYFKETNQIRPSITLLEDYQVLSHNDKNILCIGGGLSVDRKGRIRDVSYWVDEIPIFNRESVLEALKIGHMDIIATHDCPEEGFMLNKTWKKDNFLGWAKYDPGLAASTKQVRETLSNVLKELNKNNCYPEKWIHAHYHLFNEVLHKDENDKEIFIKCLNVNEQYKLEYE